MFSWNWFLDVADGLLVEVDSSSVPEAVMRTSVSRAYYACFHAAKRVVGHLPRSSQHRHIVDCLSKHQDAKLQKLGRVYERLFMRRVSADYHERCELNKADAMASCSMARYLVAEFEKYPA